MNKTQLILIIVQTLILFLNIAYLVMASKEIEKRFKSAVAMLGLFVWLCIVTMELGTRILLGITFFIIGVIIISIPLIIEKKVTAFLKMPFYIMNMHKIISIIVLFLWVIGIILIYFNLYAEWFIPAAGMLFVWIVKVVKDNKATWFIGGPKWFD